MVMFSPADLGGFADRVLESNGLAGAFGPSATGTDAGLQVDTNTAETPAVTVTSRVAKAGM